MGLEDLIPDDAGNGGGGRPKSREIGETIEPAGEPYLPEKDSKEWWLERLEDVEGKEPVLENNDITELDFHIQVEVIGSLSDYTAVHPVKVRKKLAEHEILETDWEEYIDFYPDAVLDSRVPHYDGDTYTPQITDTSWDDVDYDEQAAEEDVDSGLMSLVEDAKE